MAAPQDRIPQRALDHLNAARGISALAVLVGHVRGLFLGGFDTSPDRGAVEKALFFFTGLGHQAVVVFFVLSGFFIGTSVLDASARGRWSWANYARNRFTRLYIVLIPALVLTTLWDASGMHLFGANGNAYQGHTPWHDLVVLDATQTSRPSVFVANLFFLQSIRAQPYGSNSPLWSLSFEFWFYLLFPLIVRALAREVPRPGRIAYALGSLLFFVLGGRTFAIYFAVWGMGALAAWARQPASRAAESLGTAARGTIFVGGGLAFAVALTTARTHRLSEAVGDIVLGLVVSAMVLAIVAAIVPPATAGRTAYGRSMAWLADFSYTLYLAHYPPLVFTFVWLSRAHIFRPDAAGWGFCFGLSALVALAYAYPLSRLTEANTDRVRAILSPARRVAPVVDEAR